LQSFELRLRLPCLRGPYRFTGALRRRARRNGLHARCCDE